MSESDNHKSAAGDTVLAVEAEASVTAPASEAPKASDEVFAIPRIPTGYVVVAVMSLLVGIVIGGLLFGGDDGLKESTLRIALREELARINVGGAAQPVNYYADDDPFLGPADAPIVIVEFSDFLCSFCGRHFAQTLQPLLQNYDGYIRYVYRDYPGVGGQYAVVSALGAECANDQGRFWDFHNTLFNNQQALATDSLESVLIGYARDLSLDVDVFTTCLQTQQHLSDIILDRSDGDAIGMRGTPGFLINGRFISGAQPYETFATLIDAELARQGIVID